MAGAEEWQAPPGADVILRASGGKEFPAHKLILSLASPVFRDMFSVPQSPPTESSQLPVIDLTDPPETLKNFLQIIYPTRNPLIDDAETLASVLRTADKYGAQAALNAHKDYLPLMYIDSPPIHKYAILCACGREKEAEAAARCVSFASLASLNSHPLLRVMTIEHYQRLIRFMVVRDKRTREIVSSHQETIEWLYPCNDMAHVLYFRAMATTLQAAFEENPCIRVVEALGIVSNAPHTFPPCRDSCMYNAQGLRGYAEGLFRDLVQMAQTLPWEN